MLFSSSVFLFVFLPVVLIGYYGILSRRRKAQNVFLLIASLLFYAWGEPYFVFVMLASIAMNYVFGRLVHRGKRQSKSLSIPMLLAVVCNLGLLFLYKYLTFFLESLHAIGIRVPVPEIELPIGISFFTFQALSYVLDVASGKTEVQKSFLSLGLYISFFPQLIAGPIVKYATVADQIEKRQESWNDFSSGCVRFVTGLGKKVLLSNQFALVVDRVFAMDPADLSSFLAWLGSIFYTFQIYYDFSGYSDMAIGLGRMFGFHFRENFAYPYEAQSVSDFWRKWHISLSEWFRDYVYIPLGGNRVERKKQVRNLLVVWLLTGIWHGANWTFLVWGFSYFLLLYLEKFHHLGKGWPVFLKRAYTLLTVNFLWMLFRSRDLAYAGRFFLTMIGLNGTSGSKGNGQFGLFLLENKILLVLAIVFSLPFAGWLKKRIAVLSNGRKVVSLLLDISYVIGLSVVAVLSVACLVKGTYNPFIYFNF